MIDEVMAAALAGEGSALEKVVHDTCDIHHLRHAQRREPVADIERASQCYTFVDTYGWPVLYWSSGSIAGGC
jgi:hypothetical protein